MTFSSIKCRPPLSQPRRRKAPTSSCSPSSLCFGERAWLQTRTHAYANAGVNACLGHTDVYFMLMWIKRPSTQCICKCTLRMFETRQAHMHVAFQTFARWHVCIYQGCKGTVHNIDIHMYAYVSPYAYMSCFSSASSSSISSYGTSLPGVASVARVFPVCL